MIAKIGKGSKMYSTLTAGKSPMITTIRAQWQSVGIWKQNTTCMATEQEQKNGNKVFRPVDYQSKANGTDSL